MTELDTTTIAPPRARAAPPAAAAPPPRNRPANRDNMAIVPLFPRLVSVFSLTLTLLPYTFYTFSIPFLEKAVYLDSSVPFGKQFLL